MTSQDGSTPKEQPPTLDRPRYGEYAPVPDAPQYQAPPGYQAPQQQVAPGYYGDAPYYQAAPPSRRTRKVGDLVATCILLAVGFFGMLSGVLIAVTLSHTFAREYAQYGLTYQPTAALPIVATTLWVSHLVLFLAAVGSSIPLLVKRRIAFWVPLVAGVLAALVFWGGLVALIASDPTLMAAVQSSR